MWTFICLQQQYLIVFRYYDKVVQGLVSVVVRSWKGTKEGEFWTMVGAYHNVIEVLLQNQWL